MQSVERLKWFPRLELLVLDSLAELVGAGLDRRKLLVEVLHCVRFEDDRRQAQELFRLEGDSGYCLIPHDDSRELTVMSACSKPSLTKLQFGACFSCSCQGWSVFSHPSRTFPHTKQVAESSSSPVPV
jgi:hypothetical protein